jgi:hypothetical protein
MYDASLKTVLRTVYRTGTFFSKLSRKQGIHGNLWLCFSDLFFFHQKNNRTHMQTSLQAEVNWVGLPGQPLEVSSFETLSSLQEAMGLKAKRLKILLLIFKERKTIKVVAFVIPPSLAEGWISRFEPSS